MIKSKHLTVGKLRKILRGLPAEMEVCTADHDHDTYDINTVANYAEVLDQNDASESQKRRIVIKMDGPYLLIRP